MAALRVECDEASSQVEEMKARIKVLEQENLAKEQEITSLTHKNSVLEAEVEKLENGIKEAKAAAEEGSHHGSQNESLTRRLQLLEEEAEQADRNLRETNEKYDATSFLCPVCKRRRLLRFLTGSAKPTSRPATTSARSRPSNSPTHSGNKSTRRWPRSTRTRRRSWMTSSPRLATSKRKDVLLTCLLC